ncbi:MAG: peptidoglycan-binding protein [bacterium]|nr:peptidoglycan-binding protein [bacterium]
MKKYFSFLFVFSLVFILNFNFLSPQKVVAAVTGCALGIVMDPLNPGTPCSLVTPCATPSIKVNHLNGKMCVTYKPALSFTSTINTQNLNSLTALAYNPNQINTKNTKNLQIGSSSSANVILLQIFLSKQGLLSTDPDGKFGPKTKAAVASFQQLAGIKPASGYVGPMTLLFLDKIMYPGLVLKDATPDVLAHLQSLYQQAKKAGNMSAKPTVNQVLTQLLAVPSLSQVQMASQYSCTTTGTNTQICLSVVSSPTGAQTATTSGQSQQVQTLQNQTSTSSSSTGGQLSWGCTDPSCNQLVATTTPWWESNNLTLSKNPSMPGSCLPLTGRATHPLTLKFSVDGGATVYKTTSAANGKIESMHAVCQYMAPVTYGEENWRKLRTCTMNLNSQNESFAIAAYPDGKIAEGIIGTFSIAGHTYKLQDYELEQITSKTAIPNTLSSFTLTQLIQEINNGVFGPNTVLGSNGVDPWGTLDHINGYAEWIQIAKPGNYSIIRVGNCGDATPASSLDLKVNNLDAVTVDHGEDVEISWNTEGLSSCTATSIPVNTSWTGTKPTTGTVDIANVTQNTTFTINCMGDNGPMNDSVQVKVRPTVDLKVNNQNSASVVPDSNVTLTWTSTGVTSCTRSGGSPGWSSQSTNQSGTWTSQALEDDMTFTFTINCTGPGGSKSDSVTVEVGQIPHVIITATPTNINAGSSVSITWSTSAVTSCTATSIPSNSAWTGPKAISGGTTNITNLSVATEFKIDCVYGSNQHVMGEAQVQMNTGALPTVSISANPNPVTGGNTTLTWSSTNMNGTNPCTATSAPATTWVGPKAASGQFDLNGLAQNTTFQISCTNTAGQNAINTVSVSVQNSGAPEVLSITKAWDVGNFPKSMFVTVNFNKSVKVQNTTSNFYNLPTLKIVSSGATGYNSDITPYTGTEILYIFSNLSADPGAFKFDLPLPSGMTVVDTANPSVSANLTGQWQ